MKKLLMIAGLLFFAAIAFAQQPLTGAGTGGSYKLIVKIDPQLKADELPYGDLDIDKLLKDELDFNLDYNSGAPDYRMANVSGVATSTDGKTYVFSGKTNLESCKIQFTVKNSSTIRIKVISGNTECGFDAVHIDGTYARYAN